MRAVILVCVLSGCSSVFMGPDTGATADAGTMPSGDAAMEPDSSVQPDSGMPQDGGTEVDAGSDAGTTDSGTPVMDAGMPMSDAGRDGGMVPPVDAGTPDAGPTTDTTAPVQLALGDDHTCLLRTSGNVHCWGDPASDVPVRANAVSIAADGNMTCATTSTGSVSCWNAGVPTTMAVPAMDITTTSCGIGSTDLVSCWNGVTGAPAGTMRAIDSYAQQNCSAASDGSSVSCWNSATITAPAPWVGMITQVAVGQNHACVLAGSGGSVWCWGNNGRGQVGSFDYRAGLGPTMAGGADGYAEVVAGRAHTCGRRTDGSVWCWGDNSSSQLGRVLSGTASRDHQAGEVLMDGARLNAVDIDAGRDHTCAILTDRSVVCWGSNALGQLGVWVDGLMSTNPVEPESFWTE